MTSESEGEELGVASLTGRKARLGLLGEVMLLLRSPHGPSLLDEMCPVSCLVGGCTHYAQTSARA